MVRSDGSKEKDIIFHGEVDGTPIRTLYGGDSEWEEIIFSVKLSHDTQVSFKNSEPVLIQAGTSIVVDCRTRCFVRVGDNVELIGRVYKNRLKHRKECYHISSNHVYNDTIQFSFDY